MTPATNVSFFTDDPATQRVFDAAERGCAANLRDFCGRRVLIEGGGYDKIWLETQPMGGEMYAGRDLEAALNNTLLFIEHQRGDGRLPGSIAVENGNIVPQFNKMQGFCFPHPALNLYYWADLDASYLELLKDCLERFDAYLWRVRDSNDDGCLESWCITDTGEDGAARYGDAPFWWTEDVPPEGFSVVPIASMDLMGFSYAARDTLFQIAGILKNWRRSYWRARADAVRAKIKAYLWSEKRGACFDRDRNGKMMNTLLHNNLRLMYWGAMSNAMARRFVSEHLLNPGAFWTPTPLPSVAVNDPLFQNARGNNWSGQPQGLTYQRAIRALENYGFESLLSPLWEKLRNAIGNPCFFSQQYDPFTGAPTGENAGYGPTMLAALSFVERLHGIHLEGGELWWSAVSGASTEYTLTIGEHRHSLRCGGGKAEGMIDGRVIFTGETGFRVITDRAGQPLRRVAL